MASINKLSNNSSVYGGQSTKRIGGLASGLDTDELIEGMTMGTRGKINKKLQAKQTLEWKSDAYRGVSDKLVGLSQKYMNYTSKTNLSSPEFFARTKIEALGANNKFVDASGKSRGGTSFSLAGVKQMAKDTVMNSKTPASDSDFTSGLVDIRSVDSVSTIEGNTLSIKYGVDTYSVKMMSGTDTDGFVYDYSTKEKAIASINRSLAKVDIGSGNKLSSKVEFTGIESDGTTQVPVDNMGNKLNPSQTIANFGIKTVAASESNNVEITGGTAELLSALGLAKEDKVVGGVLVGATPLALMKDVPFGQRIGSKTMTFDYNGTRRTIGMPKVGNLSSIAGSTIDINYNGSTYKVTLDDTLDYTTVDSISISINKSLKNAKNAAGDTVDLSGKVSMKPAYQNNKAVSLKLVTTDTADTVSITAGTSVSYKNVDDTTSTDNVLDILGFTPGSNTAASNVDTSKLVDLSKKDLVDHIQKELDTAFGRGRISVQDVGTGNDLQFQFVTKDPSKTYDPLNPSANDDTSSVLSLVSADAGLLGSNGVLKMNYGEANRLNLNSELGDAGLARSFNMNDYVDADGKVNLVINGVKIEGLTSKSNLNEVMTKINSTPEVGVRASYLATTDKFTIVSTDPGASGNIAIDADSGVPKNLANVLFGAAGTDYDVEQGRDAIIGVVYEGSSTVVEIKRSSNTMTLDGINMTLKGEFGYSGIPSVPTALPSDYVKFDAKVDADKISKAVEDMIQEYNDIVELVSKEVSEKRNREYAPLTDEQKADMTESQIKTWEEKAQAGILFGDVDLRALSDDLRSVFSALNTSELSNLGIKTSGDWKDNGKLVFDEVAFKTALETDSDAVMNAFTKTATETVDPVTGKTETLSSTAGFMGKLKKTTDKYAKTEGAVKGILIEKAGSSFSALSQLKNSLLTQMQQIDKDVKKLNAKLKVETERYTKKFTQLEQLVSQMNNQSSWLNQQ